jgi:ATP-dependent protease Clp ATPase subunit
MPVYQIDMTSITEEGFKGSDTKAMVKPLLEQESTNGIGIAFLDEFDKKLMPTYASSGQNVNAVVQAQILTTVEGRIFAADNKTIDTTNTLFIALGSFDECRKKKKEIIRHVGFGQENEGGADHYTSITRKDMIKLGASYELIGRFPIIVNFQPLEDAVVDNIIDMMVRAMRRDLLIYIQISPEMRQYMHASANSKYGCRLLKGMLYEAVMPAYGKLLALGYDKQEHKIYIERRDAVYILKKSEIQEKVVLENDELEI